MKKKEKRKKGDHINKCWVKTDNNARINMFSTSNDTKAGIEYVVVEVLST